MLCREMTGHTKHAWDQQTPISTRPHRDASRPPVRGFRLRPGPGRPRRPAPSCPRPRPWGRGRGPARQGPGWRPCWERAKGPGGRPGQPGEGPSAGWAGGAARGAGAGRGRRERATAGGRADLPPHDSPPLPAGRAPAPDEPEVRRRPEVRRDPEVRSRQEAVGL